MTRKAVGMDKSDIEKKRTKGPSLWQYKVPDAEMSDSQRAVDFLHWASKKFPKRPVPITHIVRVAQNLPKLPLENQESVETFRKSRMPAVKKLAVKVHGRPVVPVPGMGWRMATDDEDTLTQHVERVGRRVISGIESLDRALSLVDERKLPNKRLKTRYSDLKDANRQLTGGIKRKLLPAETEESKK